MFYTCWSPLWGSFENYVHQGLKLSDEDIKTLKNRLLE
ncbi:MAG: hypothetical protein DRP70_05920 [Spirochaetes bacterium]|nr:MAG: hypothetical protein DRP70_05920 [Spirochaetota bacterium]